ncbi:MAG: peptidylprolyl isomerase [Planctomycetota bacterium]|jgi:peptidyl-prolyl cis-trans isomerase C
MEEKLNFSLPEKKQKNATTSWLLIILLLILTGLVSVDLILSLSGNGPTSEPTVFYLSAEQTKQLAGRLGRRNLYNQAAKVWQDYLAIGELTDQQRARTMFQIGTLLEKADLYDQAIEYYYRSETAAKLSELEPQINAHIKNCFEKLGKFSALRYELMDRTSLDQSDQAGRKIVAEIGAEKITEADLDAMIENTVDNQLESVAAFMTVEQLNEQKKKMLEQYKSGEAKQQYLQVWLAQEILYRQALEEGLGEKIEIKKLLDELTRGLLGQQMINRQLADKIHITETDLQTYYQANKGNFVEPAKAKISHILVDDEQQGNDLIKRIKDGEDFGELAKQFTKDEGTKENGGKIDSDVTEGSYIPVIGESKELNEKIFAADAPVVLDSPIKTEKGWEIVKIEGKTAERQKSFDEVRQQVMNTLTNQKRQDVQQDYIKEMMDKHNVIVHTSAMAPAEQSEK